MYISLDNRQDSWVDSWVGSSLQKGHLDPQEILEISPERVGSFRQYVPLRLHTAYLYICFFVFLFCRTASIIIYVCLYFLFNYWFIYPPIHPSIDPSINLHNCCVWNPFLIYGRSGMDVAHLKNFLAILACPNLQTWILILKFHWVQWKGNMGKTMSITKSLHKTVVIPAGFSFRSLELILFSRKVVGLGTFRGTWSVGDMGLKKGCWTPKNPWEYHDISYWNAANTSMFFSF